jgi:hypothetical protein
MKLGYFEIASTKLDPYNKVQIPLLTGKHPLLKELKNNDNTVLDFNRR